MGWGVSDYPVEPRAFSEGSLDFHVYRGLSSLHADGDVLRIRTILEPCSVGSDRSWRRDPAAVDASGKGAVGGWHADGSGGIVLSYLFRHSARARQVTVADMKAKQANENSYRKW